jgi:ABC-2 type transport system ATP-binding protein
MNGTPAIALRGVRKAYGDVTALHPLDLEIPRGSTYGLLGPNGAGKTTTIRMILRIIDRDAGTIEVLGEPLSQRGLDRIGYLPEERGVYRRMRVRALLAFLAELKGIPRRDSAQRIEHWLERMELADRATARVQELSKGMQQKVQFIGTMLHEPEVVILDEPFSGLDPINQRVLREIIGELKQQGRTILFSTHIIEHAERICDHVCIIARGRKVADGSIPEVKRTRGGEHVAVRVERWTSELGRLLRAHPAVAGLREQGDGAELALRDGGDPHGLLDALLAAGARVRRFEILEPSLEQVFIDRVGAVDETAEEMQVAHV